MRANRVRVSPRRSTLAIAPIALPAILIVGGIVAYALTTILAVVLIGVAVYFFAAFVHGFVSSIARSKDGNLPAGITRVQ